MEVYAVTGSLGLEIRNYRRQIVFAVTELISLEIRNYRRKIYNSRFNKCNIRIQKIFRRDAKGINH